MARWKTGLGIAAIALALVLTGLLGTSESRA